MTMRQILLTLLIAAGCAAAAYWFYTHFEKVKKEIDIGYQGEARNNDLLAAQRFFQSFRLAASSHEGMVDLPPTQATLILPGARYEMGQGEAQRLRHWVQSGGHLVVVPSNAYGDHFDRADALLDPLGIHAVETEAPQSQGLIDVDWPGEKDFMTVSSDADIRLEIYGAQKLSLSLEDNDGIYLMRLPLGKGWITVLPDARFMRNSRLGSNDHAAYLWRVAQVDAPRPVWLVYQDNMPPLPEWLARNAWQVLLAAALLLILGLWAASRRFGPLAASPPIMRRRLLDHVEASGRFLWRHGQAESLMKGVRLGLHRALELRHPAWASLPSALLYQRLGELSGLTSAQVQLALLYTHLGNEHEFTHTIQTLERIRKAL